MDSFCRICGSSLLNCHDKLILHECPLTDEFVPQSDKIKTVKLYSRDIEILQCETCWTVQNPNNFDYSAYYIDYAYTTGASTFTKTFMMKYADLCIDQYLRNNNKLPSSVVEPGSGDGMQLSFFHKRGLICKGVEPSNELAQIAEQTGISTDVHLFSRDYVDQSCNTYDICISSYTLDHCPDPVDYVISSNRVLNMGGIIAFEIHDFSLISERAEYCLFEHEHTIYMTAENAKALVTSCGFDVLAVNPISRELCRANSLILVAKKIADQCELDATTFTLSAKTIGTQARLPDLQKKISSLTEKIDLWVESIDEPIVGYGAGGRGIMTLAQLKHHARFTALLDIAFDNRNVLTPKTFIPIVGPHRFEYYCESYVLVFSFGYYNEIKDLLVKHGFSAKKIKSLKDFM